MRRVLAPLLLLAACAAQPDPAPRGPSAIGAALPPPAAAPTGPVLAYDGRYVGTLTLNPDRTRACPAAPNAERELVVRNGRASFSIDPNTRQVLTGTVGRDGEVRMADAVDRTTATSGIFHPGGFRGDHRNGLCSYAVLLTKRD